MPQGMLIKYRAVRDAIYRARKKASRKDTDAMKSAKLWLEQIESQGGKAFFQTQDDGKYTIAWVSQFQRKVRSFQSIIDYFIISKFDEIVGF